MIVDNKNAVTAKQSGKKETRQMSLQQPSNINRLTPGLITREKEPVNLEFPFSSLKERITPDNLMYIRNHFSMPEIEASAWKLTITGEVDNEIEVTYAEIIQLPSKTVMATLECAGNGRAYLVPKAKGLLWEQGGIGTAEWTGVPLSVLLNKAGIKKDVIEIILEGADFGQIAEEPKSPGAINFAYSISLDKAMQQEVLLAYKMNGKELTKEHGFPVRVIVPGYYGMSSVKWISRIVATSVQYKGYWQTLEYAYWERQHKLPVLTPVTKVLVKSSISRPVLHETIPAAQSYFVTGAAWAGDSDIEKVELSMDEGKTWNECMLLDKYIPFAWQLWEFEWAVPAKPGKYKLLARATDKKGNTQPAAHHKDKRTYMINHTVPVEITVE